MNKIIKNYILNSSYEIVALIIPLFTAPYLSRVLHADNYGIYSYISSISSLISTIVLIGLYTYGSRQIAYERDDRARTTRVFWEITFLRLSFGLAGVVVYFIAAYLMGNVYYFILYFPFYLSTVIDCSWFYVGIENMEPCVCKNTAAKLLTFVSVFLIVKTTSDVGKYLACIAFFSFCANVSIWFGLPKYIDSPRLKFDFRTIAEHIKRSLILCLPTIATQIYLQVDKVMIGWLTEATSQVSFYDQAEKIVNIPLAIITALTTVMMPRIANRFAQGDTESIELYLFKAINFALMMSMPMMVGMAVIAYWSIPWYLGMEYIPTVYAIIIIAPIVLFNSLTSVTGGQYFTATNQVKILFVSGSIACLMNITINAVLIPRFGFAGAAAATLLSSFTALLTQYIHISKQIRVSNIFRSALKYFIAAIIMGGVILYVTFKFSLQPACSTTIIQIVIGITVYFGILVIIKDEFLLSIKEYISQK